MRSLQRGACSWVLRGACLLLDQPFALAEEGLRWAFRGDAWRARTGAGRGEVARPRGWTKRVYRKLHGELITSPYRGRCSPSAPHAPGRKRTSFLVHCLCIRAHTPLKCASDPPDTQHMLRATLCSHLQDSHLHSGP